MKIIVALVLIIKPAAIRDIYAHDRSTLLPYLINKPVSSKQHGRTSSTTIRPAVRPNSTTDCRTMHVIDLPACRSCLGWDLPFGTPIDAIRATWTVWRKSHVHILPALKLQAHACAAPRPLLLHLFSPCVYCTPGWRRPEGGGVLCAAIRPKFGSGICGCWCRGGMQLFTRSRRHRWLPAPQGKEEHPYLQLDSEQPCKHMGMVCMESRTV